MVESKGAEEARRRRSLLAALERIGRTEEEEETEGELQPPQRDDESGFTVNKCILGAMILVGIGTAFFSGLCHSKLTETFQFKLGTWDIIWKNRRNLSELLVTKGKLRWIVTLSVTFSQPSHTLLCAL